MEKEKCFMCKHDEIEIIESSGVRFFQCKQCSVRWGKYIFKD